MNLPIPASAVTFYIGRRGTKPDGSVDTLKAKLILTDEQARKADTVYEDYKDKIEAHPRTVTAPA